MIHEYNGILIGKSKVLVCSKGDSYGFKMCKFDIQDVINLPNEKAIADLGKFKRGEAVTLSLEESGFIKYMSVRAYQKEMTVDTFNIRIVSATTPNPATKDVPENVQALGLVHVAIATSAQSGLPVDKVPYEMSLVNAKAVMAAFDNKQIHIQIVDSTKKVVADNRMAAVAATPEVLPTVKIKPRYDTMANDGFYLAPEGKAVLSAMIHGMETGVFKNANLLLVGASGNGKTSLAYVLAKVLGWDIVKVSPANISEPEQFFGYMEMVNGTTHFQHTDFSRAITTPKTVVLIDELNRAHSSIANGIFNALDDTREVGVKGGTLKVAENVIFVATINIGSQYAGTFSVDAALTNRFTWKLEMGYMPFAAEVSVLMKKANISETEAKQIVKLADRVRTAVGLQVDMSHRTTLALAYARMTGLPLRSAIEFSFIQGLDADTKKGVIEIVNVEPGWGAFDPINSIVANIF